MPLNDMSAVQGRAMGVPTICAVAGRSGLLALKPINSEDWGYLDRAGVDAEARSADRTRRFGGIRSAQCEGGCLLDHWARQSNAGGGRSSRSIAVRIHRPRHLIRRAPIIDGASNVTAANRRSVERDGSERNAPDVRVGRVIPAAIGTGPHQTDVRQLHRLRGPKIPMGRLGRAEEMTACITSEDVLVLNRRRVRHPRRPGQATKQSPAAKDCTRRQRLIVIRHHNF
jgi:hypothetical protein